MINYRLLLVTTLFTLAAAIMGVLRLEIDTDVVRSLPSADKVISDGMEIFKHHPVHDQIAVDIALDIDSPDTLVDIATLLEQKMEYSGLFSQVGTHSISDTIPELALYSAQNLPLLLSKQELENTVAPLLEPVQIQQRLAKLVQELGNMEGIGQAKFIGLDPLGLKDVVLAKMAPLAPSQNNRFYKGYLLSADGHHLLVTAKPRTTGTDTASARKIARFIATSTKVLTTSCISLGHKLTLTPVGAYRAALDNEEIIRHDVRLALGLATLGIGLLLIFFFPRPLIGLLSLVPALFGISIGLFIYSLFHSSISIMVLGFGGAIISITVDHGIAYLLFLDRPYETKGREASHEVRAISLMAVISTIGAFLILSYSGFPIFTELGRFTALGIFFSFLFVHCIFPEIFPTMPAGSDRPLPLRRLVSGLYTTGKPGAIAATIVFCGLFFFASPQFHVSLSSMNTVGEETLAADARFTKVWGTMEEQVFLMHNGDSVSAIQSNNDRLLAMVEQDTEEKTLEPSFIPSILFPGLERGTQNLRDWQRFWDKERVKQFTQTLINAGKEVGFTADAFAPFLSQLDPALQLSPQPIPQKFYKVLGISENEDDSSLIQFLNLVPGTNYDPALFSERYGRNVLVFDSGYFTSELAEILFSTFTTMLAIVAISVALLLFFFFFDLKLTLLTLLPAFFAFICTLGTLKLIGHPLDIPALMLSIVIFGMGIDYSIFCVRGFQRYRQVQHPSFELVRVAVFMAGCSTLIGFGVLCFAQHSLLKSIGITSLLGIGYSLIGTFFLLPPLLKYSFCGKKYPASGPLNQRVRHRFRGIEAYPRMFARFKLKYDPMFKELPEMLEPIKGDIKTIIDIGCGYGVPACWLLERYSRAVIHAIDPDPERVRVARLATGERGRVSQSWARDFPAIAGKADLVILLDMLHYLDDATLVQVFKQSFKVLEKNGALLMRFVIQPDARPTWSWKLEERRIQFAGRKSYYRSQEQVAAELLDAGFTLITNTVTTTNPELVWVLAKAHGEKQMADQVGDAG